MDSCTKLPRDIPDELVVDGAWLDDAFLVEGWLVVPVLVELVAALLVEAEEVDAALVEAWCDDALLVEAWLVNAVLVVAWFVDALLVEVLLVDNLILDAWIVDILLVEAWVVDSFIVYDWLNEASLVGASTNVLFVGRVTSQSVSRLVNVAWISRYLFCSIASDVATNESITGLVVMVFRVASWLMAFRMFVSALWRWVKYWRTFWQSVKK